MSHDIGYRLLGIVPDDINKFQGLVVGQSGIGDNVLPGPEHG